MSDKTNTECLDYLLHVYESDWDAAIDRWHAIESNADSIFNFSSSVTAILVGIYIFSESLLRDESSAVSMQFVVIYFIGIVLFVFSAAASIKVTYVKEYYGRLISLEMSEVHDLTSQECSFIKKERLSLVMMSLQSIYEMNESKAKDLRRAQQIVFAAIVFILFAMFTMLLFSMSV